MPKYTLTYFDAEGAAEKVRLCFKYAGAEFEDVRLEHPAFLALKPSLPLGQLPVMQIDGGEYMIESDRLAHDVARAHGLYPDAGASQIEEIVGLSMDIMHQILPSLWVNYRTEAMGHADRTPEQRAEIVAKMRADLMKEDSQLHRYFAYINKLLLKNGTGFVYGDKPTLGDAYLLSLLRNFNDGHIEGIPKDCLDKYDGFQKFFETQYAIPAIKAHYKL